MQDRHPSTHTAHLAELLKTKGERLCGLGRYEEAMAPTREAADLYRELALADPTHDSALAGALSTFVKVRLENFTSNQNATELPEAIFAVNELQQIVARLDDQGTIDASQLPKLPWDR
jgi:hypothetical protein